MESNIILTGSKMLKIPSCPVPRIALFPLLIIIALNGFCSSFNSVNPNNADHFPSNTHSYNVGPAQYNSHSYHHGNYYSNSPNEHNTYHYYSKTPQNSNSYSHENTTHSFHHHHSFHFGDPHSGVSITHMHGEFNFTEINVFYPEDEICCSGKAFPKRYSRCCGNNSIDITRQVCCIGVSHDLKAGFACCGEQYIDVRQQICCWKDGVPVLQNLPPLNSANENDYMYYRCCSDVVYDSRTHQCCRNSAAAEEVIARESGVVCRQSYVVTSWQNNGHSRFYCNNQQYNPNKQLCCGVGLVNKTNPRDRCCGDKTFNPQLEICCHGWNGSQSTIQPKVENESTACCGSNPYNPNTQFCCQERKNRYWKKVNLNHISVPQVMDLPATVPRVSAKCCSDKAGTFTGIYNSQTHVCCEGNIKECVGGRCGCCGENPMNEDTHFCCNGTAIEILSFPEINNRGVGKISCCFDSTGQTTGLFVSRSQKCCDGVIFNATHSEICCGNQLYNRHTGRCCGNTFIDNDSNQRCCGRQLLYDPQNQICCHHGRQVLNKDKMNDTHCCGSFTYNRGDELCCESNGESVIYTKRNRGDRCCGLLIFHGNNETCCQGDIVPKKNKGSVVCCGRESYDPRTEICCGNQVHQLTEVDGCCGSEIFNTKNQICCAGKVKEIDPGRIPSCCMA